MSDNVDSYRIELRTLVRAPANRVFSAWADPARLAQWYPEQVDGELREGARVRFGWSSLGVSLELEVCERIDGRRLVLRGDPGSGVQTQSITLTPAADGTEVVLEHAGLRSTDEAEGSTSGWRIGLAILAHYVERYWARPRQCFAVLAPVRGDRRAIYDQLVRPAWLADPAPRLGPVGQRVALRLRDGPALSVEVIADTAGRELAIHCDDVSGVIAFRTFPIGAGMWLAGAHASCWSADDERIASLRAALIAGVERLVAAVGGASGQA